jgi:integrase/recombinase XerC
MIMSNPEPVRPGGADWSATSPQELVDSHLARPSNTRRAYREDLICFAEYMQVGDPVDAVEHLVSMPAGAARRQLDNYLAWLRERYSLNTARRRLSSVRGLLTRAHEYEVIPWAVRRMPLPTPEPVRDTRGPHWKQVDRMLEHCRYRGDAKGARDTAMLRLMGMCGYRANEILTLDVGHVDLEEETIQIVAKGRWGTDRKRWPVDHRTAHAIGYWLEHRGLEDGPLFTTLERRRYDSGERLTYHGLYSVVADLGAKLDIPRCHPHALRHSAATTHMALSNGNVALCMCLTRHTNPKTVMIYNDSAGFRRAREAMEIVAGRRPVYRYDPDGSDNL